MRNRLMHTTMNTPAFRPSAPNEGDGGGGGQGAGAGAGGAGDEGAGSGDKGGAGGAGGGGSGGGAGQGGKGGGNPLDEKPWYDGLPDELKGDKTIQRHTTLESAINALRGAEKRLGVPSDQLIRKPTKPEEMADVYRQLGAPEKPEDYKIEVGEGATDADKAMATAFAAHMHAKGPFPPDAVAAAVEFWNGQTQDLATATTEAQEAASVAAEAALKKAWGADYEALNKDVGLLLLDESMGGGKDLVAELEASPLGDKVNLMKLLGKVAEMRREPGTLDGAGKGKVNEGAMTPAAAKAQLNALNADPVKGIALRDRNHSMHAAVLEERNKLAAWSEGKEYTPPTT